MLSRVAESLYWMGRYLERAEHTARVVDVHLDLMLDQPESIAKQHREYILAGFQLPIEFGSAKDDYELTNWLTFAEDNPNSIVSCIASARQNARQVRERISSEMWQQINQLYHYMAQVEIDAMWSAEPREFYQNVKEGIHLVVGLTDSTISHGQGYRFIQTGRFIERAVATAMLMDAYFAPEENLPKATIESHLVSEQLIWTALLRTCTAFEAYSKVYTAELNGHNILEFLLLDQVFPHSLAYAVRQVQYSLQSIADITKSSRAERAYRRAGRLQAELQYGQIDEVLEEGLHSYLKGVENSCLQIHEAIYQTYISYPVVV